MQSTASSNGTATESLAVSYVTMNSIALLVAGLISLLLLANHIFLSRGQAISHPGKKRRVSINSQLFARGPFGQSNNPSNIVGTFWFRESPSGERLTPTELKHLLRTRALRFERLRCLLTESGWVPQPAEEVDLDPYVVQESIATRSDIRTVVSPRLRRTWDHNVLPFYMVIVRVEDDPSHSCIVMDLHHGVGDGLSCIRVLFDLLTDDKGERLGNMVDPKSHHTVAQNVDLVALAWTPFSFAIGIWHTILNTLWTEDSPTSLKRPTSFTPPGGFSDNQLRIEYVKPVSLAALKALKSAYGVTLNDICVAALSGAYRRLLQEVGQEPNESTLFRALCPFSFARPIGPDDTELHNGFVAITLPLSVSVSGPPSRRIEATRAVTNKIKSSFDPVAMWVLQYLVGITVGYHAVAFLSRNLNRRHSVMFTNVPGPDKEVFVCGRKVTEIGPSVSALGTSWALLSYAGRVCVSYNYDPEFCGDASHPERIGELFLEELEAMMVEAKLENQTILF